MIDGSNQPNLDSLNNDFLARLFNRYRRNSKLIFLTSIVSIMIFLFVALAFPLKDRIFERLYPKPKSQASSCSGTLQIPENRGGFIFTGGDLDQAVSSLQTSLYDTYDLNLAPKKSFFVIGRYAQNPADPLGLRLLMENNLINADFKGLPGQAPGGWNALTSQDGSASVDTQPDNTVNGTSIKLTNNSSSSTQISQAYKKSVAEGQYVVFGSWVKTENAADVKVSIQNSQSPNQEFGSVDTSKVESNRWTYVLGYGKVPQGVTNFQIVLKVSGAGKTAWFDGAVAEVNSSDTNQTIANLVLQRCGSAWMIDDAPGWEESNSAPFIKALPADLYALIYSQFYSQIKNADPSSRILPGGLMGAPIVFDSKTGYSPLVFLDGFRTSYKNFFNSEPPIDILGIRYLATDKNRWDGSDDLINYLAKLRDYMDKVAEWKGKPIWLTRLGVSKDAPNGGVDFLQAATKSLSGNNLNIEKWLWYDTCGFNAQLAPLFTSSSKICSWPIKLTALGQAYVTANALPISTPALPIQEGSTATPSATVAPTEKPVKNTPTPNGTSSTIIKEGTNSGENK